LLPSNRRRSEEFRYVFVAASERLDSNRVIAHLSIALCRAMNIPARYVNGYLGDIAIEPNPSPMDFNAWFEAYLDGGWHLFDVHPDTLRTRH
jgi:transglutaminase-like putative cysteine protease